MPEGGSGAGMSLEVSKIVLKLETNFQEVLKKQVGAFDKFTKDANALTRQVGTNMNQLARTTSQSFNVMFKGNKREVQELVSFTRSALQGVRRETLRIQGLQERFQQGTIARYQAMRKELTKAKPMADVIGKADLPGSVKESMMRTISAPFLRAKEEYQRFLEFVRIKSSTLLPKYMANAVNEALNTIAKGSRAAAVTVNNVVKDMQSRFNQLYSQRKFMSGADFAEAGTGFLKQRAAQIKVLENLLRNHQKKQEQAERYLAKQKELLSMQTNKTLYNHQKQMVEQARAVVKKLGSEYEFMFNKIQSFSRGQTAITGVITKQAQAGLATIKQTLRGLNLKRDFQKMWSGLEETARLAGQRSGQAFFEAVRKGKALDTALIEKKKHLQDLLQQAKILQATGLIDARRQIRSLNRVIGSIKEFRAEYVKVKKEIASIPNISAQKFAQGGIVQARALAQEVRNSIAALRNMGKVSEDNVINVQISLRRIQSLYRQHTNKVAQSQRTLAQLQKEMDRARLMGSLATNEQSIKAWQNYYNKVSAIYTRLTKQLQKSVLPTTPLKEFEQGTLATIRRIRTEAGERMIPVTQIRNSMNIIKKQFEEIGTRIDQLSRKRVIKPENLKEGQGFIETLKKKVSEYNQTIRELNVQLERLRRLQKAGLTTAGMSEQIQKTKDQMMLLQQHVRQYERMQVQVAKRMATVHRQSLKGSVQGAWEMIRNFRWQVAAVIYLATRAVWFINRTIMKMLDQIYEYRKNAMSIAAAISFQMIEKTQEAFDKAYSYSRKLMNQLEMVAAETILTLEDMVMLTKTFAQAGIVPKTEQDVRRIATIGTAIKALTEGMANAGVQMRQELYAVIQGRQRATDQLAKMFQVMGINIQKLIEDAKKEGKSMIVVLSDALEPFSEMNKRLKNEWEQVKNRVAVVWKLIQRIGGETFLVEWSKSLNMLLDQFVTKSEEGFFQLTEAGVHLSAWVNTSLNSFKAIFDILVGIVSVVGSLLQAFGQIVMSIKTIAEMLAGVERSIDEHKSSWDGILWSLQVLVQTLNVIAIGVKFIAALIKSAVIVTGAWVDRFRDAAGMIERMKKLDVKGAYDFYKKFVSEGERANEDIKNIWIGEGGWLREAWKSMDDINRQFDDLRKKAAGINDTLGDVPDLFKLPENYAIIAERAAKLAPKLKQITLAGLEGPEKFKMERMFEIEEPEEIKAKVERNLVQLRKIVEGAIEGKFKVEPKKLAFYTNLLKGHEQTLADMNKITAAAYKKEGKQIADWNEKMAKKMARWKREHDTFWESLVPKDLTRAEKTNKWFAEMLAKLDELKVKNPLIRKEFEKFKKALDDALSRRRADDTKAINEELKKMEMTLTSHRPVDVITKINNELDKIGEKIRNNINWDKEQKKAKLDLLEVVRRERIDMEKLNMTYQASSAELDAMVKRAEYMAQSYSPVKRMQADLELIKLNYKKTIEDIQKEIDTVYRTWVKDGQWATTEGAAEAKRYVMALQDQMSELTRITQRELQRKQMPIWNDIVDASNTWADGFTSSLAEIVDGLDSVSEALNQLQKQILKDVIKIVVKRSITDQLQDLLGSGRESPMSGFFGLFPGGKVGEGKPQEITATKPIPVTVFNPQDLMGNTIEAVKPLEKMPMTEAGGLGMKVFVTNWPVGGMFGGTGEVVEEGVKGVAEDLSKTTSEIAKNTEKAKQDSRSWYSGIQDIFSGIGDWFTGLFAKIGAMFSGGGGGWWASAASTIGSFFMQEGGVINEHVVGKGLESGATYNFGERAKYGESEMVAPMRKIQRSVSQIKIEYHMPINLSAVDTQTGVQFLMKHSDTIQAQMIKNLKHNKPIRKGIQNAY